ncbi:hypothetical protein ACHQM5_006472 [Ranunculus cassubicifolius]
MGLVDYDTDTEDPLISKKDSWVKTPGEVNPGETMTVGGVTRKVISMEKAMKRELSFKTKLEVLQKKTQTVLQKPSSIQGVTATAKTRNTGLQGIAPLDNISRTLPRNGGESHFQRTSERREQEVIRAGVKRKNPPSNQSCPPPQHAAQLYPTHTPEKCENTNYKCKECDIICCGLVNLQDHYQGRKHKSRVEELKIQNGVSPMETKQLVYNIQDSSERSGAGANVRTDPVCIPQGPEPVRKCEVCNCICPGLANYNQHMKGKKHKTRLEQLKLGNDNVGGGTEPINCEICKVVCMNEFAYKQHQAGKKHAVALQAIRYLNQSENGKRSTSRCQRERNHIHFYEFEVANERSGKECGKMKIMEVELAMRRESAYKRKLEMLQLELDHRDGKEESSVPVQEKPLRIKHGANLTPLSEKMLSTQPPQLSKSCATETIQTRPSANPSSHLSLPRLQQSYSSKAQVQSAESRTCIPPPPQLPQYNAKEPAQIQPSQNLSRLPPPKPLQMQPTQNLSSLVPSQISQPSIQPILPSQPSQNFSQIPPPHCQQPFTMNPIQKQLPQNLSQLPPPQNLSQLPPPQNLSQSAPAQLQHSHAQSNLYTQPPTNPSYVQPTQFRQHRVRRTLPIQPISLVCKECQVPCSSAATLRKHYKGRKHRARVEELRLRRQFSNQQASLSIQNTVMEPLWCDICKIRCMNENCFQLHLEGKKHLSRVQAINTL